MSQLVDPPLPPQSTLELCKSDPSGDVDISLIEYNRSLTFAERIRQNDRALDMAQAFRKAGLKSRGHPAPGATDPSHPE